MQHWQKLNKYQQELLLFFGSNAFIQQQFYFAGGTNLVANYFGHRQSDDIDLFSDLPFDGRILYDVMMGFHSQYGIKEVIYKKIYDRHQFEIEYQDGFYIKLDFVKYFPHVFPLLLDNQTGLSYESYHDCFLNKIMCIYERDDAKDMVDLYELLHQDEHIFDNKDEYSKKKFGSFLSDFTIGIRMMQVLEKVKKFPELHGDYTAGDIKKYFKEVAAKLGYNTFFDEDL